MIMDFDDDATGPDGRILVRVDKDIEDLVPVYLDMTKKDVESLKAALSRGDFDAMYMIGHSLKGSGGGYGFDGITEIGGNIEQFAQARAREELKTWIGRLSAYLDRVEVLPE